MLERTANFSADPALKPMCVCVCVCVFFRLGDVAIGLPSERARKGWGTRISKVYDASKERQGGSRLE